MRFTKSMDYKLLICNIKILFCPRPLKSRQLIDVTLCFHSQQVGKDAEEEEDIFK